MLGREKRDFDHRKKGEKEEFYTAARPKRKKENAKTRSTTLATSIKRKTALGSLSILFPLRAGKRGEKGRERAIVLISLRALGKEKKGENSLFLAVSEKKKERESKTVRQQPQGGKRRPAA